jgi:hypothetical protein
LEQLKADHMQQVVEQQQLLLLLQLLLWHGHVQL